jgi:chorismate dehydratase
MKLEAVSGFEFRVSSDWASAVEFLGFKSLTRRSSLPSRFSASLWPVRCRLRISFIEFLNAVPLGWGLLHGSLKGRHEILRDVPSECARRLAAGEADVGLIPAVEYQRIPGLRVIPGISIAARREARSVLFVSRVPIRSVSRVAVDTSSRSSTALLRILMSEFYGVRSVPFIESPPNPGEMLSEHGAALLIGNAALRLSRQGLYVYDLAHEWNRFTGLPFVFAFWAVREAVVPDDGLDVFVKSKREGLAAIPLIAEWYASRLPVSAGEIRSYLTTNLDFSLGAGNLEGLERFYDLAVKHRLIDRVRPLRFAGETAVAPA